LVRGRRGHDTKGSGGVPANQKKELESLEETQSVLHWQVHSSFERGKKGGECLGSGSRAGAVIRLRNLLEAPKRRQPRATQGVKGNRQDFSEKAEGASTLTLTVLKQIGRLFAPDIRWGEVPVVHFNSRAKGIALVGLEGEGKTARLREGAKGSWTRKRQERGPSRATQCKGGLARLKEKVASGSKNVNKGGNGPVK